MRPAMKSPSSSAMFAATPRGASAADDDSEPVEVKPEIPKPPKIERSNLESIGEFENIDVGGWGKPTKTPLVRP